MSQLSFKIGEAQVAQRSHFPAKKAGDKDSYKLAFDFMGGRCEGYCTEEVYNTCPDKGAIVTVVGTLRVKTYGEAKGMMEFGDIQRVDSAVTAAAPRAAKAS